MGESGAGSSSNHPELDEGRGPHAAQVKSMMETMRAIVKPKPAPRLTFKTVPVPKPSPDDVVIRVRRTAICVTDVDIDDWNQWSQVIHESSRPLTADQEAAIDEIVAEARRDYGVA